VRLRYSARVMTSTGTSAVNSRSRTTSMRAIARETTASASLSFSPSALSTVTDSLYQTPASQPSVSFAGSGGASVWFDRLSSAPPSAGPAAAALPLASPTATTASTTRRAAFAFRTM